MEQLNNKFNLILEAKEKEIEKLLLDKKKDNNTVEITYATKSTLYKIQAEQDKKKREAKRNKKDYSEY